jgi:hypothetical protein
LLVVTESVADEARSDDSVVDVPAKEAHFETGA